MSTLVLYTWTVVSFPGYLNPAGSISTYVAWFDSTNQNLYNAMCVAWLLLNVCSTVLIVVSIRQILKTVRLMQQSQVNVNVNQRTMLLHSALVVL